MLPLDSRGEASAGKTAGQSLSWVGGWGIGVSVGGIVGLTAVSRPLATVGVAGKLVEVGTTVGDGTLVTISIVAVGVISVAICTGSEPHPTNKAIKRNR